MRRKDREVTDPAWIDETLTAADACRIALVDEGKPYIVALNYGFERSADGALTLYFHCAKQGKKLDIIRKNPAAAFFIDTAHELVTGPKGCDWGMKYKSVAGSGFVAFVEDADQKKKALDLIMEHYSGRTGFDYDERVFAMTEILSLKADEISAKEKK